MDEVFHSSSKIALLHNEFRYNFSFNFDYFIQKSKFLSKFLYYTFIVGYN